MILDAIEATQRGAAWVEILRINAERVTRSHEVAFCLMNSRCDRGNRCGRETESAVTLRAIISTVSFAFMADSLCVQCPLRCTFNPIQSKQESSAILSLSFSEQVKPGIAINRSDRSIVAKMLAAQVDDWPTACFFRRIVAGVQRWRVPHVDVGINPIIEFAKHR